MWFDPCGCGFHRGSWLFCGHEKIEKCWERRLALAVENCLIFGQW